MRLFAAVDVGDQVREAATAVRARIEERLARVHVERPRIVWTAATSLHVTLRFFGDVPEDRVARLVDAIRQPVPLPPFVVEWRGLGAFPSARRPRALWIGVTSGARELGQLESEMASRFSATESGDTDEARPFHPHVTLGRIKVDGAPLDWPAILGEASVASVRSTVNDVTLYRSHGRPGGAGYEGTRQRTIERVTIET